jgi:glyoxylase-like metal-dependent hydrolase (beta-lactamase superfamily II)
VDQPEDWTAPGAFEVSPGVHRIPLPLPNDGLRAVNVYALDDGDELVVVDGGWALDESVRRLEKALGETGRSLADVRRFLVTHAHRDHYTQAVAVRRTFGARVSLGFGERPTIDWAARPVRRPLSAQTGLLRRCGADEIADRLEQLTPLHPDVTNWEYPDDWLDGSTPVPAAGRALRAIPTPGHTAGHLVFAEPEAGLLFAGDHVLPHITPSIGFEPVRTELPLRAYLQSLALVRRLPDMRLLPAHGPVTGSVHSRVDELLDHHGTRLDACQAAVESGRQTAYEVAQALPWTRRGRRFAELTLFNQMLAVCETDAHLELLVARGRLSRTADGGVLRYGPAGVTPAGR